MARQLILRVKAQLDELGIAIDDDSLIAECEFAKNILTCVGGHSLYEGLYDRTPAVLAEFEPAVESQLDDSQGMPGISRGHHRVREIVILQMVNISAAQRLNRAQGSQTRLSAES